MMDVDTLVDRRSVRSKDESVPQRPKWMPKRVSPVVVRARMRRELPFVVHLLNKPSFRHRRQDTTAFVFSLLIHVMMILVGFQLLRYVTQPATIQSEFIINTEFDQGDGVETELLSLVDSPVPRIQPVANLAGAIEVANAMVGDAYRGGDRPIVGGGGGFGFFGAKAAGDSVVFVVDRSGSMADQGRMEAAKEELTLAIQQLQPYQQFYVIFYSNKMFRMLAPDPPENLLPASPENVQRVIDWIDNDLQVGGGTEPLTSLLAALKMKPNVIFFLTDGDVDSSTAATVHLNNAHGTIIHTICLSEEYGEAVMQRIALENNGRYRFVETASLTRGAFDTQTTQDENIAAAKLKTARRHLEQGHTRTGQRWLVKLIKDHPDTPQAREAEQMLASIVAAK
ncbi:MAG: VWA domain-containing protein [Planctomycetaceae bacterium]|nr:VWA domain-containing protein [Planctomycetaceae bacterium]